MNDIIKINNHDVTVKEYKGQRVVTFKDIDMVHERPEGTAGRNFRDNKTKFIEDEEYFYLTGEELKQYKQATDFVGSNARELVLITEAGYLMLVKSLSDDLAWDVQRKLVKSYFKTKDLLDDMSIELRAVIVVDQRVTAVEKRVDHLENDVPLYGSEADELSRNVKKKGVSVLGGKNSNAYKDNKLRSEVYSDIYNQIKREFGLYDSNGKPVTYKALKRRYFDDALKIVDNYVAPKYLQEKIDDCNAQLSINEKRSA